MENRDLILKAMEAKEKSYSPYSNFKVGAAILTEEGEIFTGCNIENAGYSPTICAERTAIVKAVSEGYKKFKKIAIVAGENGGFPCGVCRQFIREFSCDIEIIIAKSEDDFKIYEFSEIFPYSFGPDDLK